MRRNIIRQGNGSCTITLPARWIKDMHLEQSDDVEIKEIESNLVISAKAKPLKKETEVDAKNLTDDSMKFLINQIYRKGYSQLKIFNIKPEMQKYLHNLIEKQFTGFEIITKNKDCWILQVLTEPDKDMFFNIIIRKMFLIIEESLKELCFKDENIEMMTDKFRSFEQLAKRYVSNNMKNLKGYEYYSMLSYLMILQANVNRLRKSGDLKSVEKKHIQSFIELFSNSTHAFFNADNVTLFNNTSKANHLIDKFISDKQNFYVIEFARIFYSMHSPMIGILYS